MKTRTVKILGQTVRMGSKKHIELLDQVRHFNDLSKSETGSGQGCNSSLLFDREFKYWEVVK